MGDSLQEQLRALGLAGKEPKLPGKRDKKKVRGQRGSARRQAPGGAVELSLDEAYALREREEQREAERARQEKLAKERLRREINEKIRQIVRADALDRRAADLPRNFLFKGRIRKIYVTAEQQRALTAGELGIVYLAGSYHLLAEGPLEAVRAMAPDHVVDLGAGGEDEEDHPVPDDLVW